MIVTTQKKIWRMHDGTLIYAHAVWQGSWFVGTLDKNKPKTTRRHTTLKMTAGSREEMEQIIAEHAERQKWTVVQG